MARRLAETTRPFGLGIHVLRALLHNLLLARGQIVAQGPSATAQTCSDTCITHDSPPRGARRRSAQGILCDLLFNCLAVLVAAYAR